jgi:hypothetical protein
MSSGIPPSGQIRESARAVLDDQWREPGFSCPNGTTYPWLWLWDSCFHAIVWAELGEPDRAVSELAVALSGQDDSGFVPHLLYLDGSSAHAGFWGRAHTSSITQPPIYGHTVAELARRGIEVAPGTLERATAGLRFLFEQRRRSPAGLIEIVHPWESGCDHSPRWDDLMVPPGAGPDSAGSDSAASDSAGSGARRGAVPEDPYDEAVWFRRKGELLSTVRRTSGGAPLSNDAFAVGSVAFSAMTVFCADELVTVTGDRSLASMAAEVREALADRWEPGLRTWIDDGPTARGSGRIRTSEVLTALLVETRREVVGAVVDELTDPSGFGGDFGPTQVHRGEPRYRPASYWRGPSWPQLDYLLHVALERAGRSDTARLVADGTVRGAVGSGWAEYWDADTGRGGGAAPQSWTTLAACLA